MGSQSFLPGGLIATAAQAQTAGRGRPRTGGARRRKKKTRTTRGAAKKRARSSGGKRKPKFGTKAWMAYIRGMRGKRKK